MKQIILTQNKICLVDNEDFGWLIQRKWYTQRYPKVLGDKYYAHTTIKLNGRRTKISMQRLILNAPKDMHVDHINRDTLQNTRDNLRLCLPGQNTWNSKKIGRKYPFKGITKYKNKFGARIQVYGKSLFLGCFDTGLQAALAYDEAAIKHFGEFACTNKKLGLLSEIV